MIRCALSHVRLENFTVRKGRDVLVEDVSLALSCGQLTALIGGNGAGKTTLIRALLGEIPHQGKLLYLDHHGKPMTRPRIGYVPQQLDFDRSIPMTVNDFLLAARTRTPVWLTHTKAAVQKAGELLESMNVADLGERKLGELSGGELQRVLLALALDPMPDLLILDEPVSGVDIGGLDMFYQRLDHLRREYHMTILLVTHDMTMVEKYADQVALLRRNLLKVGTASEVLGDPAFREVFRGVEA